MSPRAVVRVADVDAYGRAVNTYTGRAAVAGPVPASPWAVYLADESGRFRLLCFDLDVARADPAADAALLTGWLAQVGAQGVVTRSGPAGGRHVWVGLAEPIPAQTARAVARAARACLPSLDISPLTNPVTGCARPPGAPHRAGGASEVLHGDLVSLTAPTTTNAQVEQLLAVLLAHGPAGSQDPASGPVDTASTAGPGGADRPLPVDEHGRPYLPGPRLPLPADAAAALALDGGAGDVDASHVLWRVLLGATRARWRCADVAALVPDSPGLEYVRTHRADARTRTPRRPGTRQAVLTRHWDRAVRWAVANPRAVQDQDQDPTFEPRCGQLVDLVEHVQARADAAPGRWAGPGGPAHRRVLDALCLLSLQAVTPSVEADIRRLALLCGIGRESARTALLRLADDGWVTRAHPAQGPRAAIWSLDPPAALTPPSSTGTTSTSRSQAVTRPPPGGALHDRGFWVRVLGLRLAAAAHDVFTYGAGGLGHHCGHIYSVLTSQARSVPTLVRALGYPVSDLRRHLHRLEAAGLVRAGRLGWAQRPSPASPPGSPRARRDRRDLAAVRLQVDGRLVARVQLYGLERELWGWWTIELAWMRAARRSAPSRRAALAQLTLTIPAPVPHHGAHPRRADGRADYRASRRALLDQRSQTTFDTAPTPLPGRRRPAA